MTETRGKRVHCGTDISGSSDSCILCYQKRHRECPNCMVLGRDGRYRPRNRRSDKNRGKPVDCGYCNNERWILLDEIPAR